MNKLMLLSLTAATLLGGCATGNNSHLNSDWGYYDRSSHARYGSDVLP